MSGESPESTGAEHAAEDEAANAALNPGLGADGSTPTTLEQEEPLDDGLPIYVPEPGEAQLTARAVIAGSLLGSVVSCTNIYIGLKIGWTFGASIVSAVLAFSLFAALGKKLTILETNIAQTAGSAAGAMASAAGLVAAIPALEMLGYEIAWWELTLWALSVAYLGVFYAVPLRRQMVEIDKLRFPTGTATAHTVKSMAAEAAEAAAKAKWLIVAAVLAGGYTLAAHFVPAMEHPPLHEWIPVAFLATAASWGFSLYLGPALFGAGFIIGPRVALSLLIGAIVSWGVLGPFAQASGWAPNENPMVYADGARGWLLWPGVALMVSEALTTLALSWKTFVRALRPPANVGDAADDPDAIPRLWWMGGLGVGTLLAIAVGYLVFGLAPWLTLIAVALSSILAVVAVRSTGETDINPVGGMGKVTQLVYGALAPGQAGSNLLAAAVTGAGASQASDMMQDLKTGYLLGASARKQFLAQLVGIAAGVVFVVPAYYLFTAGVELGSESMPAPAAMAWKAMAELLTQGLEALPVGAPQAVLGGVIVGALISVLRQVESIKAYVPSALAMGIAFIVPAYYSLVMVLGLVAWFLWSSAQPEQVKRFNFALSSGLIVGEGLMGLVNAALSLLGY